MISSAPAPGSTSSATLNNIFLVSSSAENIQVALFMEQENMRVAKTKGFLGIFTTNSNRLTQLISRTLNYQVHSLYSSSFFVYSTVYTQHVIYSIL